MFEILTRSETSVLIALAEISCGSAQEICTELERIDLNEFVTNGETGVFLIRARGDSMETDIRRGDLLIVNRNLQPQSGDAVVAFVNGDYIVKDYKPKRQGLMLVPRNDKYQSQTIKRTDDFEIFGVVTDVLRKMRKS